VNWQFDPGSADVVVVPKNPPDPCFQPDMPSDGNFMACMSTGNFYGGSSNGGVRTDLTSGPIEFEFKPGNIKISFDVDFQSEESLTSIGHNDAFEARLVTAAGTFPIVQIDTFGRTRARPGSQGRRLRESSRHAAGMRPRRVPDRHASRDLVEAVLSVMRPLIARGPVFLEFSVTNQGDDQNTRSRAWTTS
jgi:hypothetical protein